MKNTTRVAIFLFMLLLFLGTTRIAINAKNLFGVKVWGYNPNFAWLLKGQPDEDYELIPVIANYGENRIVYDESKRI